MAEREGKRAAVGAAAGTYKSPINDIVLYAHSRASVTAPHHEIVCPAMVTHLKSIRKSVSEIE